ncbi:MAG TPA: HAMP domain-containing histidine kinase [Sorangium sp.]|nr:HAMP domain-containing histidine kinase [Sorangium sp.]
MDELAQIDDGMLRELMSSFSHDIRNPLAAIITNLAFSRGLGNQLPSNPDVAEALDDSIIACDVLQMIVSNMDVITKTSTHHVTRHLVTVAAVVKDVVKRVNTRAAQSRVNISFEEPPVRLQALLDRTNFALAIQNLIGNAITHAPKSTTVRVVVTSAGPDVCVHFEDEGIVIPPALRDYAVSPMGHTRAGRREETRYSRGLGLLSAARAATLAGASLELSSTDDGCNCFTLHTPRRGISELSPD